MIVAVGLSKMAFIRLKKFSYSISLLSILIIKTFGLSRLPLLSIKMVMWVLFFISLIWCITLMLINSWSVGLREN